MDIDTFQEKIGGISKYQILVIIFASWLSFAAAYHGLAATFLSAVPNHRCSVPPIDDPEFYNLTESEIANLTIPYDQANREYESCSRYNYNLTNCNGSGDFSCITSPEEAGAIPCDKGYHYSRDVYTQTTVSQWNLVCDRQYLDSLANTLFFLGYFIGSVYVGPLTDWFGRKIAMFVISIGVLLFGVGCSFAPTYEVYVVLRLVIGSFSITCFIVLYIYVNEISSKKWRTEASTYLCMLSGVNHSIMPGIAYYFRDWHQFQLVCSLLVAPFFIIYFFIPESPRWLISRNRFDEARIIVDRYAASKGKVLDDDTWDLIVGMEKKKKEESKDGVKNFKVWDLFRRPLMRLLSFNVMFCWFTVSMLYFGLSLNGGNLAGDPYLNNALNGLVEIGGYILIYFSGPLGRRPILSGCYFLAGFASLTSTLFNIYSDGNTSLLTASTAFAIIGKFFGSTAFGVIYAVTAEIYPTDVRSTALSMGSMAARVGGMLSPFILQLQNSIPWFAQVVFGVLAIFSGLATLLFPETTSTKYLTTLDESEDFYKNNIAILQWFRKKNNRDGLRGASITFVRDEMDKNHLATRL